MILTCSNLQPTQEFTKNHFHHNIVRVFFNFTVRIFYLCAGDSIPESTQLRIYIILILNLCKYFDYAQTQTNLELPTVSNIFFSVSGAWQEYSGWNRLFDIDARLITRVIGKPDQIQSIQLEQCQKQQWENFTNIFEQYQLSQNACVKYPQQLILKGSNLLQNITFINIMIKRCNQSQNNNLTIECRDDEYFLEELRFLQRRQYNFYSLSIVDTSINANEKNPINKYVRLNYQFYYSPKMREDVIIQLGMYSVQTDVNLMPFQKTEFLEGYYIEEKTVHNIDRIQQSNYKNEVVYGNINIFLTNKKKIFKRKIGKIDQIISYAGGLFGILIGIFAFILNSYSKYVYELKVAEASFNYDEHGNQIKSKNFNFFKYIKFGIYDWVKYLLCFQINWTYDKQKQETRQQNNATMDVMNLYRKIQLIQIILEYICDKNELKLINLTKPPTLKQIKIKRQGLQYYHEIIGGKIAINIQDLTNVNQSLRVYKKVQQIKDSKKKLSEPKMVPVQLDSPIKIRKQQSIQQLIKEQQIDSRNQLKRTSSIQLNEINSQTQKKNPNKQNKQTKFDCTKQTLIQQIEYKFEKCSGIQNRQLINKIAQYTEIAQEAKKIKLSRQMQQIEQQFAMAYQTLNPAIKLKIINRIPLKILHRLMNCLMKKNINLKNQARFQPSNVL